MQLAHLTSHSTSVYLLHGLLSCVTAWEGGIGDCRLPNNQELTTSLSSESQASSVEARSKLYYPCLFPGDFKTKVGSILGGHTLARYLLLEWLSYGEHLHTYLYS